jgi:hypothetical protein
MKKIFFLLLLGFSYSTYAQNTNEFPVLKEDYLGQTPPGDSAVVFAPGLISLENRSELCIAFSPAGDECCLSFFDANFKSWIFYSKLIDSKWTKPDTAYFAPYGGGGPVSFSPDGQLLTYMKSNPVAGEPSNTDLYFCNRTDTGWSQPQPFPGVINSNYREAGHALTLNKTLYYATGRSNQPYGCDVFRSRYINGEFTPAEFVANLSTSNDEDGVWISPDESYAIVESWQDDNQKDLYLSFRKEDDSWIELINMGTKINTPNQETRGKVSPDGKYLFFTSGNSGKSEIYWIRIDKIINDIKNVVFNSKE